MNTDSKSLQSRNPWIIALLVSIAVNGLLIGLLLSGEVKSKRSFGPDMPPTQGSMQANGNNPRHLVRTLAPERRKQVMQVAMKNLALQKGERPRQLFRQLRQSKIKTMRLLRAEEPDMEAIKQSLAEIRDINHKLAVSGDALIIEILRQLTPEERKAAGEAIKKRNEKRRRRPNR